MRRTPKGRAEEIEAHEFDLEAEAPWRVHLVQDRNDRHILFMTFHHLHGNGPSYDVFYHELCELLVAKRTDSVPDLSAGMQLSEYVDWRRRRLGTPEHEAAEAFWMEQMRDLPAPLELPLDRPRGRIRTFRGARQSRLLGKALTEKMRTFSAREGVSPFPLTPPTPGSAFR